MTAQFKRELLPDTKTCYRYLQAGFGVILLTFLTGLLALVSPEILSVYDVLVMPALFTGLGLLLLGIGTHLHVMHLNVLDMRENSGEHH